jgi:hypothetical protein
MDHKSLQISESGRISASVTDGDDLICFQDTRGIPSTLQWSSCRSSSVLKEHVRNVYLRNLSRCSTYRLSGERTVSPLVMHVTLTSVPDCFDRLLHSGVETKYVGISPTATWTTPIHLHLSHAPVLSLLGSARLGYEHTLASSGRLCEEIMDCRYSNMVAIPLGGSPGANKAHNMWSTDENRTGVSV